MVRYHDQQFLSLWRLYSNPWPAKDHSQRCLSVFPKLKLSNRSALLKMSYQMESGLCCDAHFCTMVSGPNFATVIHIHGVIWSHWTLLMLQVVWNEMSQKWNYNPCVSSHMYLDRKQSLFHITSFFFTKHFLMFIA